MRKRGWAKLWKLGIAANGTAMASLAPGRRIARCSDLGSSDEWSSFDTVSCGMNARNIENVLTKRKPHRHGKCFLLFRGVLAPKAICEASTVRWSMLELSFGRFCLCF